MPRVLLVEDDKTIRALVTLFLRDAGCEVDTATDGFEALEKLRSDYEVVLLDLRLPGKTGQDVLKELNPATLSRVVLMTGACDEEVEQSVAATDGSLRVLRKPLDCEELVRLVSS